MSVSCIRIGVVACAVVAAAAGAAAQERVYLTEDEALSRALRGAEDIVVQTVELSDAEAKQLADETGVETVDTVYVFHVAMSGTSRARSVVVMNVRGQYEPITFYVAIGAAGNVERVEIMTYRESRGAEVRRSAFLRQFENRTVDDPVRTGSDIRHVTGATISSRAIARGVRLALALYERLPADTNAAARHH